MKILIISLITVILSFSADAKPHELDYTFSFDSGYAKSSYTNRSFWQFGLEYEYLGASIFNSLDSIPIVGENAFGRLLLTATMAVAWEYPQYTYFVSNHEFGHASRSIAAGFDPKFAWTATGAESHNSIFSFFLEGFSQYGKGAVTTTSTTSTTNTIPSEWTSTVLPAGGVNNSAMFSEFLEKEIYYNTGHINQLRAYEKGKKDLYNYALITSVGSNEGDIDKLLTTYNGKNFDVTKSDLMQGSNNSLLLSFSYWAYIWSMYNYIVEGDASVRAFEIAGFKLPDLSHYLYRDGLSYRLSSGYRGDGFIIPFAIEQIYKGNSSQEISLGFRKPFKLTSKRNGAYDLTIIYNNNGASGFEVSGDLELSSSYLLSAGYNRYDTKTLIGERNTGQLDPSGNFGQEFWLRGSFVY